LRRIWEGLIAIFAKGAFAYHYTNYLVSHIADCDLDSKKRALHPTPRRRRKSIDLFRKG